MNKNFLRDYTIEAFRHWAELGKPTYDELREKYEELPVFRAKRKTDKKNDMLAELGDVLAIEKTISELKCSYADGTYECLNAIYANPICPGNRDKIRDRVINYSTLNYLSERSVYRMLEEAHRVFAKHRGLRHP